MASDHSGIVQQIEQVIAEMRATATEKIGPFYLQDATSRGHLNYYADRLSAVLVSLPAPGKSLNMEAFGASYNPTPAAVNATPAEELKAAFIEGFNSARNTDGESAYNAWFYSAAKAGATDAASVPASPEPETSTTGS